MLSASPQERHGFTAVAQALLPLWKTNTQDKYSNKRTENDTHGCRLPCRVHKYKEQGGYTIFRDPFYNLLLFSLSLASTQL